MKKLACLILCICLLMSASVFTADAAIITEKNIVFMPHELLYSGIMVANSFDYAIMTENKIPYVHLTSEPGTYNNNECIITINALQANFNMMDYPYARIEFRSDTSIPNMDTTIVTSAHGESWGGTKVSYPNDGTYTSVITDINKLNNNTGQQNFELTYEDGITMQLRYKPYGPQTKVLSSAHYFDILYIGFFKTEEDANDFVYEYDESKDNSVVDQNIAYYELTDEVSNEITSGANSLISTIMNSGNNFSPANISGTCYYVSNNGNDENSGTSPSSAIASTAAVSKLDLKPGDAVLFERGGFWAEPLGIKEGVTYSAYGSGEKPILTNSIDASSPDDWEPTIFKNIWRYKTYLPITNEVGNICINDGEAWGIKAMRDVNGNRTYIGTVYNGYESFHVKGKPFEDERDLEFNLEYWHSWDDNNLYMYCDYGNPGKIFDSIIFAQKGNVISAGNAKNVTFDNLSIRHGGSHGIGGGGYNNTLVQYCHFAWIGGSMQYTDGRVTRYGNAVENWGSCNNFVIDHCYATQIYDCCYTSQWQGSGSTTDIIMQNITFSNLVSEYSNSGPEMWMSVNDSDTTHEYLFKDVEVYNNYVLNNGYGWSHQRPNKDGNFFYGAFDGPTTDFENVSYHNNFFYKASSIALKARRAKGPNGYDFRDNVYVMAEGLSMVETGSPSNIFSGLIRYKYDKPSLSLLIHNGFFPNSTFYHYPIEEAAVPMPEKEPPREADFEFETNLPNINTADCIMLDANDLLTLKNSSSFKGQTPSDTLVTDNEGKEYFRITSIAGTYTDGTNLYQLPLTSMNINIREYPYVRIYYKSNIQSGNAPRGGVSYLATYNGENNARIWGPVMSPVTDEKPHISVISMLGASSGGRTSGGLISNFSVDKIASNAIYNKLEFKFWGSQTATVAADEYMDIAYIAFFKDAASAGIYQDDANNIVYGDVNNDGAVDPIDHILLARYIARFKGFLALDNILGADIVKNSVIDLDDCVYLARHIAGWSGYQTFPHTN